MKKHNDDVLMTEISYIKASVIRIEEHIEKQNGKIEKHDIFISKQGVLNKLYWILIVALLIAGMKIIFFGSS